MESTRKRGLLVSATSRAYKPFTDRQTGEQRPGGVVYAAWLVEDFGQAPIEMKVSAEQFPAVQKALADGGGVCMVDADVDLFARNNDLKYTLTGMALAK